MEIPRPVSRQPIPPHARKVFSGIMFDVYQWEQKLYDGTVVVFEKLKRPDTVVVFPVLDDGKILLTEQEQPGKEPFIGAPGGRVDPGEEILAAAKRELLEETGYEAGEFTLWSADQPVSKIEWSIFTFIAKKCRRVTEMSLDGGEKIILKPVTFDDFVDIALTPAFGDREIARYVWEAKLSSEKMATMRELFKP